MRLNTRKLAGDYFSFTQLENLVVFTNNPNNITFFEDCTWWRVFDGRITTFDTDYQASGFISYTGFNDGATDKVRSLRDDDLFHTNLFCLFCVLLLARFFIALIKENPEVFQIIISADNN